MMMLMMMILRYCHTVRLKIIGREMIKNIGKSQSCMVSTLPIIFKRTRSSYAWASRNLGRCRTPNYHLYHYQGATVNSKSYFL